MVQAGRPESCGVNEKGRLIDGLFSLYVRYMCKFLNRSIFSYNSFSFIASSLNATACLRSFLTRSAKV